MAQIYNALHKLMCSPHWPLCNCTSCPSWFHFPYGGSTGAMNYGNQRHKRSGPKAQDSPSSAFFSANGSVHLKFHTIFAVRNMLEEWFTNVRCKWCLRKGDCYFSIFELSCERTPEVNLGRDMSDLWCHEDLEKKTHKFLQRQAKVKEQDLYHP